MQAGQTAVPLCATPASWFLVQNSFAATCQNETYYRLWVAADSRHHCLWVAHCPARNPGGVPGFAPETSLETLGSGLERDERPGAHNDQCTCYGEQTRQKTRSEVRALEPAACVHHEE